jgi:phospholipid/cholesterol/gamma-HCH transport system permease protein
LIGINTVLSESLSNEAFVWTRGNGLSFELPLKSAVHGDRLNVSVSGTWTAANVQTLEPLVETVVHEAEGRRLNINMQALGEIDTFGACLLNKLIRRRDLIGVESPIASIPERMRGLLTAVDHAGATAIPAAAKKQSRFAAVEAVGRAASSAGRDLFTFVTMLGALGDALLRVLRDPRRLRPTSLVYQLDRVGLQAVPIIFLITVLIGGIIAQQGIFHFRRFGAGDYAVDLVGILVLREIGVLLVAIMVAGRSGSSYTAELGSMKMREEIDALRTMGLDPIEVLLLPRVVALVCALPVLGSLAALFGGGLAEWLYGGMSPAIFIARLKDAISITHFEVGIIKAPFMALVIGVVACSEGLKVKGSAESLGLQTTTSVVKSIFLVIVLDGLFAIFFAGIGM